MGAVNSGSVGVTWPLSLFISILDGRGDLVRAINPFPSRSMGDTEKPKHNMAFLLIAPDKTIKGERVFGLVAVWVHLHQAHHSSLDEVAWKLTLLIDIGADWAYALHSSMKALCTYLYLMRGTLVLW